MKNDLARDPDRKTVLIEGAAADARMATAPPKPAGPIRIPSNVRLGPAAAAPMNPMMLAVAIGVPACLVVGAVLFVALRTSRTPLPAPVAVVRPRPVEAETPRSIDPLPDRLPAYRASVSADADPIWGSSTRAVEVEAIATIPPLDEPPAPFVPAVADTPPARDDVAPVTPPRASTPANRVVRRSSRYEPEPHEPPEPPGRAVVVGRGAGAPFAWDVRADPAIRLDARGPLTIVGLTGGGQWSVDFDRKLSSATSIDFAHRPLPDGPLKEEIDLERLGFSIRIDGADLRCSFAKDFATFAAVASDVPTRLQSVRLGLLKSISTTHLDGITLKVAEDGVPGVRVVRLTDATTRGDR